MIGIGISPFFRKGSSAFDWDTYWSTRYPSNLILTVLSDTSIKLDWTNNVTQDYDEIRIETSLDGIEWFDLYDTNEFVWQPNTATVTFTELTEGTRYYFRLRYKKDDQYSAYSNVADATTTGGD